jgi:PPOX class probable F420-dependent enzyme
MTSPIDDLDARLIALMADEPRIGLMEASRRLNVARGTVQARLAKLTERGVIRSFGPEVDPSKIGYPVLAFVFLEITQGRLIEAIAHLESVPEVLEAHATSGPRDLLCRVAAHDTEQLQEIINRLLSTSPCAARRATSCSRRRSPTGRARWCRRPRGSDAYRCAMPRSTLTDPVRELIQGRNFCHVSTLNENGSIHATLVWADAYGDHVVLNSAQGRRWPENVKRTGRATLLIANAENQYEYVFIQAVLESASEDDGQAVIDALSEKYEGRPYPPLKPGEVRVTLRFAPERVVHRGG